MSKKRSDIHDTESPIVAQPVLSTGVTNLDLVLGGGLPCQSLVILVGPPGSGKTTLANQIVFASARQGKRALIFTALSEPTNKLIAHLQTFSFFDRALIGDTVQFLSLQQFLADGLDVTGDNLIAIARQARADMVVLDGFRGVRGATTDPQQARQFLYELGTKLSVLGATTIVTSEADPRDPTFFPEATTADVIIGVHYDLVGVLQRRAIEAVKVRGASLLPGLHGLRLGPDGAVVYPRIESQVAFQSEAEEIEPSNMLEETLAFSSEAYTPIPFGLPALDEVLGGGLPRETSTLLVGSLGTGKTLLALQFALHSVGEGEPTVFLSFRESLRQMLRKADAFELGPRLRKALAPGGLLTWMRWPPVEMNPDIVAHRLFAALERTGARRLIVDGVTELEHAIMRNGNPGRVNDFLAALIEMLQARRMTTLFVTEHPKVIASRLDFSSDPISVLAENVLLTQQVSHHYEQHRVLSIVKLRFSPHDLVVREFTIASPEGIRVLHPFESSGELLANVTRQQEDRRGSGTQRASMSPNNALGSRAAARNMTMHSPGITPEEAS